MPEIDKVENSPVSAVDGVAGVSDYSLDKLVKMLLAEKMLDVDVKVRDEMNLLNDRQKRVEFLNKFLREINSKTRSSDETLDRTQLQSLLDEGMKLMEEANQKMAEVDTLQAKMEELQAIDLSLESKEHAKEIEALQKKIKFLQTTALETYDTLRACDIIFEKSPGQYEQVNRKSYTERERERLVENVRSQNKMMQDLNSFQSQIIQRVNSERHETIMLAKDIAKTLHDIKKRFASNIAGR